MDQPASKLHAPTNFRTETLTFEVVGLWGTYHAILGRPCYVKFKAIPNYAYLKLKMSGPAGTITVDTMAQHAYKCKIVGRDLAEGAAFAQELWEEPQFINEQASDAKRAGTTFKIANNVKGVLLGLEQPSGRNEHRAHASSQIRGHARHSPSQGNAYLHVTTLRHKGHPKESH